MALASAAMDQTSTEHAAPAAVRGWVEQILDVPAGPHRLDRWVRRAESQAHRIGDRLRRFHPAQPGQAPPIAICIAAIPMTSPGRSSSPSFARPVKTSRGRPTIGWNRMPLTPSCGHLRRVHGRANHVCRAVCDGADPVAPGAGRRADHRFDLRRGEHAGHDAGGGGVGGMTAEIPTAAAAMNSPAACTASAIWTPPAGTSAIFRSIM